MSDEQVVEEQAAEDDEIVVVDELPKEEKKEKVEEDPELESLRAENKRLRDGSDTGAAIKNGFEYLQEKLSAAGVPATPPAPVEDEEAFWKGVEEGLFDKAPREAIKKAINREARKLIRDELGPVIVGQMESAFENAEWRLKNDAKEGAIFEKYSREVYAELKKLGPVQQKDPRELRKAYLSVKAAHLDEIIEERVQAAPAPAPKPAAPARRVLMEGGGATPGPQPKKQVFITKKQQAEAHKKGMSDKDYLELLAYRKSQA